jgi:diadenosine tetraphosphate (Ap4A) HIT family hydrolase
MEKSRCLFCSVPPEEILIDGPIAMARIDNHPVSPGHTLIIPKRHVASSSTRYKGDRADPRGGVRWVLPDKAAYWSKK